MSRTQKYNEYNRNVRRKKKSKSKFLNKQLNQLLRPPGFLKGGRHLSGPSRGRVCVESLRDH